MPNSIHFQFAGELIANTVQLNSNRITFNYPCESQNECHPFEVTFEPGIYQFECWGGGTKTNRNSIYGAYTQGTLRLSKRTTLFLYIGAQSGNFNSMAPNNVKGSMRSSGATDIRLVGGNYYDFNSLKSRIMVAAGGGSSEDYQGSYGHGGGLNGFSAFSNISISGGPTISRTVPGGSQDGTYPNCNSGYCVPGKFGLAQYRTGTGDAGGFGGDGYYSGASIDPYGNGGGGSSFISGYYGCNAIDENSTDYDNIYHTGQSIHYSGHVFTLPIMKAGPETLHESAGKVVITQFLPQTCKQVFSPILPFSSIFF